MSSKSQSLGPDRDEAQQLYAAARRIVTLAAGDRREHVDHRAVGNGDRAVVYGDLIEQEARRCQHPGRGLAMGRG